MEAGVEVKEVNFEDALAEEAGIDQAGGTPRPRPGADSEADIAQAKDDLEILAPKIGAREWRIGVGEMQRIYIQRELSVIGKTQWFGLLGDILDKALGGENAISLNSLISPPTPRQPGQFQIQDFQDADTFVHALGKLLVFAPEFMEKSVCIWLSVPDYEWDLVRDIMRDSPEIGGMSDEMFEDILATFIDQNYPAIDSFFRQRFQRIRARFQARAKEAEASRSSKRSKTTPPVTPNP